MPRARGRGRSRSTSSNSGSSGRARGRGRGGRGRSQERQSSGRRHPRPQVISLDVTFSSSDEDYCPSTPEAPPEPHNAFTPPSPIDDHRGIMSGSDSDPEEIEQNTAKEVVVSDIDEMMASDTDSDDIFKVNYKSCVKKQRTNAIKELEKFEEDIRGKKEEQSVKEVKAVEDIQVLDEPEDDVIASSPTLDSSLLSPPLKLKTLPKRKRLKNSKETTKALKKLQALSKQANELLNSSYNSDVLVLSDEEVDFTNSETVIRIRWESNYLRLKLRKTQKFSHIYQEIAERFRVGVNQIILSHQDKIISPESSPQELGITIADTLEGGIRSTVSPSKMDKEQRSDPHSIRLRVQNADRKGSLSLHISRYDKMLILMQNYAQQKGVQIDKLRFCFDGENLDPGETPETLDLDGDECIDVYHI